jgi:hypothetical protein
LFVEVNKFYKFTLFEFGVFKNENSLNLFFFSRKMEKVVEDVMPVDDIV